MKLTPIEQYNMHRDIVADRIKAHGIRYVARATKLSHMRVSRYVNRQGADDAATHYILAAAVGRPVLD